MILVWCRGRQSDGGMSGSEEGQSKPCALWFSRLHLQPQHGKDNKPDRSEPVDIIYGRSRVNGWNQRQSTSGSVLESFSISIEWNEWKPNYPPPPPVAYFILYFASECYRLDFFFSLLFFLNFPLNTLDFWSRKKKNPVSLSGMQNCKPAVNFL